jgi:hypothetical protein
LVVSSRLLSEVTENQNAEQEILSLQAKRPVGAQFLPLLSLQSRANMPLRGATTALVLPVRWYKFPSAFVGERRQFLVASGRLDSLWHCPIDGVA